VVRVGAVPEEPRACAHTREGWHSPGARRLRSDRRPMVPKGRARPAREAVARTHGRGGDAHRGRRSYTSAAGVKRSNSRWPVCGAARPRERRRVGSRGDGCGARREGRRRAAAGRSRGRRAEAGAGAGSRRRAAATPETRRVQPQAPFPRTHRRRPSNRRAWTSRGASPTPRAPQSPERRSPPSRSVRWRSEGASRHPRTATSARMARSGRACRFGTALRRRRRGTRRASPRRASERARVAAPSRSGSHAKAGSPDVSSTRPASRSPAPRSRLFACSDTSTSKRPPRRPPPTDVRIGGFGPKPWWFRVPRAAGDRPRRARRRLRRVAGLRTVPRRRHPLAAATSSCSRRVR